MNEELSEKSERLALQTFTAWRPNPTFRLKRKTTLGPNRKEKNLRLLNNFISQGFINLGPRWSLLQFIAERGEERKGAKRLIGSFRVYVSFDN